MKLLLNNALVSHLYPLPPRAGDRGVTTGFKCQVLTSVSLMSPGSAGVLISANTRSDTVIEIRY